jgi:ubiquinol-cytochrome c reductase cytochrome b subunit
MSGGERVTFKNPVVNWIDERLPVFTLMQKEYGTFPTPRNFNYFWNFGAIATTLLVVMILSGIFLAMHYTPHADHAFSSVEHIMRDVNWGWFLRYLHMNGASFFFLAVYIHIYRGMYYGSYKKPRELLWILGVLIFLLMMATAFIGYSLVWSQMAGWAVTVITNLFSAIPFGVGEKLVTWLWGGFSVDNPTLNRFFALHYLLPFVIFAVVFVHIWALHISGSNNPLGIDTKGKQDTLPFHPYYTAKDTFGLSVFLLIFVAITFFYPNMIAHPAHFEEYNPMVTPPHIVPEWYFLPFYAILRAITFDIHLFLLWGPVIIPAKLGGVIAMFGSVVILFFLPWLDTHAVRSARFRPQFRMALISLVVAFLGLGWVGAQLPEGIWVPMGQICTAYYFAFFLVILPWLSRKEQALPLPPSIHEAVLK